MAARSRRTDTPHSPLLLACPNCGESFGPRGEWRRPFCPGCGQDTALKPPTVGEFLQQFGGAYLSTEGALWRTLGLLLRRPGELTAQYLAGRRRQYVLPLRLYLTVSVVALLVIQFTGALSLRPQDLPAHPRSVAVPFLVGEAGVRDGAFYCRGAPAALCERMRQRLDVGPEALGQAALEISRKARSHLGTAMFVAMPIFALWLRVLWGRGGLRYTEHLVFTLHLHAFWALVLGLYALLPAAWAGWPALAAVVAVCGVYSALAGRRVYRAGGWQRTWRGLALVLLYTATILVLLRCMALASLLL